MNLDLVRCYENDYGTFGRLFVDGHSVCYTLEPKSTGPHPCVPAGAYQITLKVVSPKYRFRSPYNSLCKGCVPRLLNVPGRSGILIHIGNFLKDTSGCILVGQKRSFTRLFNSTVAFKFLYNLLSSSDTHLIRISYVCQQTLYKK